MLFNFLGPHLASGNSNVTRILAQLSGQFAGNGEATASARGLGSLSASVQREGNVLAYIDGFRSMLWFAIAALACIPLIGSASAEPFTPEAKQQECL